MASFCYLRIDRDQDSPWIIVPGYSTCVIAVNLFETIQKIINPNFVSFKPHFTPSQEKGELTRCKWELPHQHITNRILTTELFPNIFIISTVCSHDMSYVMKLLYLWHFRAWLLLSTDPVIALGGSAYRLFSLCCNLYTMSWGPSYEWHTS